MNFHERCFNKPVLMRLCHPQDGGTSPKYKCYVLNHHNLFDQIQNALAFNWDMWCHLALCLWLLPFHCLSLAWAVLDVLIRVQMC
jgi:hypothetical protein